MVKPAHSLRPRRPVVTAIAAVGALAALALLAATGVRAAERPERVVAIGGAVTEIVHALGRMDALVAVDSTSTYPPEATALPDVGYMRRLSAEPIIALAPDRVIAMADAGPPVVFEQLREAGLAVTRVPDRPSPGGVLQKVRVVAAALGVEGRGRRLVAGLSAEFAVLRRRVAEIRTRPTVLTLIAAGPGNMMAAGTGTSAEGIVRLAGGRSAITAYSGFRPLSAEAVIAASPDWLLLTNRALDALEGRAGVRAHPVLGATQAAREGHIMAMDALLLLGFGPRTPAAAERLAQRLHPASSGGVR